MSGSGRFYRVSPLPSPGKRCSLSDALFVLHVSASASPELNLLGLQPCGWCSSFLVFFFCYHFGHLNEGLEEVIERPDLLCSSAQKPIHCVPPGRAQAETQDLSSCPQPISPPKLQATLSFPMQIPGTTHSGRGMGRLCGPSGAPSTIQSHISQN